MPPWGAMVTWGSVLAGVASAHCSGHAGWLADRSCPYLHRQPVVMDQGNDVQMDLVEKARHKAAQIKAHRAKGF